MERNRQHPFGGVAATSFVLFVVFTSAAVVFFIHPRTFVVGHTAIDVDGIMVTFHPINEDLPVGLPLPYAPAALLFAIIPTLRFVSWARRRFSRTYIPGTCPACGYDVRATPFRCPECGV